MTDLRPVGTVEDVIAALGGSVEVARRFGLKTSQGVWPWRNSGHIPPKYYHAMIEQLRVQGCTAPARLWGMVDATATP